MKKIYSFIALASVLALLPSCSKESFEQTSPEKAANLTKKTFCAIVESSESKTILDGQNLKWESSDDIAIYDGVAAQKFTVKSMSPSQLSATFEGYAKDTSVYLAVAPFNVVKKVDADTTISIKMPSKQVVSATHRADSAAMISTAYVTDGTINFKNQFSLVKVNISRSDIVSVILATNDQKAAINGTQFLSKKDGSIIDHAEGYEITLTYADETGAPAAFVPGDYYFVTWPAELTAGFTLKFTEAESKVAFKTTDKTANFPRNGGLNLKTVDSDLTFISKTISTAEELKEWAKWSNYWTNEDEFKLGADIDLGGYNWPTVDTFKGTLDGQGYSITNFVVNNAKTRTGFIGTLDENGKLKNITFGASSGDSSSITLCQSDDANWCYAGIVGYVQKGASVDTVTTNVPVNVSDACTGKHSVGGICGNMKANSSVVGCVNNASVTDNSTYNSTSADACIGGIVGMSDSAGSIIKDCRKNGEGTNPVTNNCPGTAHIGGIVGRVSGGGTVEGCTNDAYVYYNAASAYNTDSFKVGAGGIVGAVTGTNATIIKCINEQRVRLQVVQTTRVGLGGVVGIATGSGLQILGCVNNTSKNGLDIVNTKDIAIGGIIGYSGNTIKISKAEDGTYTKNKTGFTQDKAYNSTAYVGGIAGLLDKDSDDNIVEYSTTASGTRFEFSKDQSGATKKTINAGGICGASKGVIRNCTNNMHIYSRKGSNTTPYVKYGGICGGASNSRHPRLVTNCTNNGNFGCYNLDANTVMGGIVAVMYPGIMNVTFCTNTGTVTSGQCAADGVIKNLQSNTSTDMGGLCGDLEKPAAGTEPITIFEGCKIGCKIILKNQSDYRYIALVAGWPSGTKDDTGLPKLILGTKTDPIQIINTSKVETGTNADPTVESVWYDINSVENAKKFFFGPHLFEQRPDGVAGKGNFTSIDGDDFTARFELNFTVN